LSSSIARPFRQRLDDFVQLLRRQRQRSALRNGRRTFAAQADLEIRREHLHFRAVGFEQHVRENRNRVLALDYALEELQFAE
jgi:hypothetical protein